MLQLSTYRVIFLAVGLIAIVLFSLPTINLLYPTSDQKFSEIYILGPNHTFGDLPFNIIPEQTYLTYVGVRNNLDRASYYTIMMKIAGDFDNFPDPVNGTPSRLPSSYILKFFVTNGQISQTPLTFSIEDVNFEERSCTINQMNINGFSLPIGKTTSWDSELNGFYFNLIVELWICNPDSGFTQFNNRYVSLPLNVTNANQEGVV